ncbi:MAG: hypothetical protein D6690_11980 [Nitrospirae bacterium]|nr:MAG: hypothetical protein D6690_11980 [Nitrospirota bacterium]
MGEDRLNRESIAASSSWAHRFLPQWQELFTTCTDPGSRSRLMSLRARFEMRQWPMAYSAAGEIDVASRLVHAGFSLAFLEETSARTADLECYWGQDRCFVEVTVMAPTPLPLQSFPPAYEPSPTLHWPLEDTQTILERRLIARMAEKARQLDRYCAPIILAITVPMWTSRAVPKREEYLDVQRLAGVSVSALAALPTLSAVLLTFWDAKPRERRSTIRLADVHCVTRTAQDPRHPRIRALVNNPFARYALTRHEKVALQQAL